MKVSHTLVHGVHNDRGRLGCDRCGLLLKLTLLRFIIANILPHANNLRLCLVGRFCHQQTVEAAAIEQRNEYFLKTLTSSFGYGVKLIIFALLTEPRLTTDIAEVIYVLQLLQGL